MKKKLTLGRKKDAKVGGVCQGLADYFNIDVSFVRLVFVFGVLIGASAGLLYFVIWAVVPYHPEDENV